MIRTLPTDAEQKIYAMGFTDGYKQAQSQRRNNAETTQDCVSRQEAIDAVGYYSLHSGDKLLFADKPLKELPSAQPQRTRGEWVDKRRLEPVWDIMGFRTWGIRYKCSICRFTHMVIEDFGQYKFCPNCGAQMDGGEQDGQDD